MKKRVLAVLLVFCLAVLPIAASAAPAAEVLTRSHWFDLLSDLVQHLFVDSSIAEEEESPAAPLVPLAPHPTADTQELNPDGGTEQNPDLDPIG